MSDDWDETGTVYSCFVIFLILELITQTVLIKYIFFIAHHFEVYYVLLSPQMQPLHLIGI